MTRYLRVSLGVTLIVGILLPDVAVAQTRTRVARETAEYLIGRFGAKAGRDVPQLAGRIERLAAQYGDDAVMAVRKGGPGAVGLVEAAGPNGAKAVRVLAIHGEQGATRVLSRPVAMKQYLQHGDDAARALVRHPGVAEPLIERGGTAAVQALGAVNPRNGRRLAMLMDGELASHAARHPQVLGVVAKHGDSAVDFIWRNKVVLAGGAALTAFLVNPEPFLNGTRDIAAVAGESVAKPMVKGFFTLLDTVLMILGVLALVVIGIIYKHARREDVPGLLDKRAAGGRFQSDQMRRFRTPLGYLPP